MRGGHHPLAWWEAGLLAMFAAYLTVHMALAVAHVTPDAFIAALARSLGLG